MEKSKKLLFSNILLSALLIFAGSFGFKIITLFKNAVISGNFGIELAKILPYIFITLLLFVLYFYLRFYLVEELKVMKFINKNIIYFIIILGLSACAFISSIVVGCTVFNFNFMTNEIEFMYPFIFLILSLLIVITSIYILVKYLKMKKALLLELNEEDIKAFKENSKCDIPNYLVKNLIFSACLVVSSIFSGTLLMSLTFYESINVLSALPYGFLALIPSISLVILNNSFITQNYKKGCKTQLILLGIALGLGIITFIFFAIDRTLLYPTFLFILPLHGSNLVNEILYIIFSILLIIVPGISLLITYKKEPKE